MVEVTRPLNTNGSQHHQRQSERNTFLKKLKHFFCTQMFCEDILKLHVFVYWLACLVDLMRSADESFLATLSVALSAFTLISALIAIAGRRPLYLIPFLIMSFYKVMETMIMISLVNYKINKPKYFLKFSKNALCKFFLKNSNEISEDYLGTYMVGNILYATYFGIVVITTLKLMKSYSEFQARISLLGPNFIVNQALSDELYHGRLLTSLNDVENVIENADSPPHYSEIFNNFNNISLPKYSQIRNKGRTFDK